MTCPQCNCMFDYIYGKWSSFECETCLKDSVKSNVEQYVRDTMEKNDQSMCSNAGICQTGSLLLDTEKESLKMHPVCVAIHLHYLIGIRHVCKRN